MGFPRRMGSRIIEPHFPVASAELLDRPRTWPHQPMVGALVDTLASDGLRRRQHHLSDRQLPLDCQLEQQSGALGVGVNEVAEVG